MDRHIDNHPGVEKLQYELNHKNSVEIFICIDSLDCLLNAYGLLNAGNFIRGNLRF